MIAIITAMDVELENILARLENAQQVHRPGLFGYTGTLHGQQVIAAVCGVGKVCAAQCAQLLISEYHPAALFHSGIAGAVSPDLRHLDVVVARELTYRDMTEETKRGFVPFGVIRCISDLANDEAHGDYDQFERLASLKSADILCEAIRLYSEKEGE